MLIEAMAKLNSLKLLDEKNIISILPEAPIILDATQF